MSQDPTPSALGSFDLQAFRDIVWDQRRGVVAFLGAVMLVAVLGTALSTRWYEAVAVLQLLPRAGLEVDVNEVLKLDEGGYMEGRDRARTQIQIIQSRAVREEALRRYSEAGGTGLEPDAEGIAWLGGHLTAGPREDTQLVEVRVKHTDPDSAALLANLVAEVYVEASLEFRRKAARETRVWLEGQSQSYRTQLEAASAALLEFKQTNDLVGVEGDVDDISTRLGALHVALGAATTDRVTVASQLAQHEKLLKQGRHEVLLGAFDDRSISTVAEQLAALRTRAAEVQGRYGKRHPEYQRVNDHLARVEGLVRAEVRRLIDAERSKLQTLQATEVELAAEIDLVKAELHRRELLSEEYQQLERREGNARRMVNELTDRGAEVDLQAQTQLSDVRVVDPAVAQSAPVLPNVPLNLVMAFVVGIAGGFAYALIRHQFRDGLMTARDVELCTELPVLGIIPSLPGSVPEAERPLFPIDRPHSMQTEAYRALRAMVVHQSGGSTGRVILVTSGVAGEGKTTTSIGLAVAFARLGRRTLLVDGDLRRPRLDGLFKLENAQGLSDTLVGRVDPLLLRRSTDVKGLYVLPAGRPVENVGELLASHLASRMIDHLRSAFDMVIIDTSPVGVVADAMALASMVDGVLMVVRRGHAPGRLTADAAARLRRANARILGTVFNDTPTDAQALRFSGGYYQEDATERLVSK